MVRIRVYNENGNIKVTKVINNSLEQVMFKSLEDGEVAEVSIEVANLSVAAVKDSISR